MGAASSMVVGPAGDMSAAALTSFSVLQIAQLLITTESARISTVAFLPRLFGADDVTGAKRPPVFEYRYDK